MSEDSENHSVPFKKPTVLYMNLKSTPCSTRMIFDLRAIYTLIDTLFTKSPHINSWLTAENLLR